MKKVFITISVVLVALILIFLYNAIVSPSEAPVTKVNGDKKNKTETKQDPRVRAYRIGDAVRIGDTEVTISSATLSNSDQHTPTTKNGKILTLDIKGVNNGSETWNLDSTDFTLYYQSGAKVNEYNSGNSYTAISGQVSKGKEISGQIKYPGKVGQYDLVYKPKFMENQEVHWVIDVK
jgi:hypothetical protein